MAVVTQTSARTQDSELFDLDVKVTFDSQLVPEILSSIACGQSECCTSWWNCPYTCNSCSQVTCCNGC